MAVKKIAISVPENVLKQIDRLALRVKATRSGFITNVLVEVSDARSRAEITERINSLFSDPAIASEQSEVSGAFLRAAEADDSEW